MSMNEYEVKREGYKGYQIVTYQDPEPESPREWDNFGTMVCFHRGYDLGDKHTYNSSDFNGWDELEATLREKTTPSSSSRFTCMTTVGLE